MTVELRWAESRSIDGVVTHAFSLLRSRVAVAGFAWYAATSDRSTRPLVLLGHGGRSHKCSARNVRLATSLVRDFDYQSAIADEGVEVVVFLFDGQVALFDALATSDKALLVRDGTHVAHRPEDERTWLEFLASHLRTCL